MPAIKQPVSAIDARKVEVRTSEVHGRGVFARQRLRQGQFIAYYTGRRHAPADVHIKEWDAALTYIFGLSDGSFIDGSEGGNDTRFINHSCSPNCIAHEVDVAGELRVEIRVLQSIPAGSELSLDYWLDIADNDPAGYVCRCATAKCRGTMIAGAV